MNLSHCRVMDFTLFGNVRLTLPRSKGSNNFFCKIIAHVFADGTENIPDEQTYKTYW